MKEINVVADFAFNTILHLLFVKSMYMKELVLEISTLILGACSILYFLVGFILWRKASNYYLLANRLLSVFFLVVSYNTFTYWLIATKYIMYVPFLYKVAFPFNYLPYPLVYLYLRITTRNQLVLQKKDWLHALPFIIAVLDYLPFYTIPLAEKKQIVANYIQNSTDPFFANQSILPLIYHFICRTFLGAYYLFLMLRLLMQTSHTKYNHSFSPHFQHVRYWLKTLAVLMAFLYLSYSGTVICTILEWQADIKTILMGFLSICTTLSILLIVLYIFKHPLVLYGLPELSPALSITPKVIETGLLKHEVKQENPKATIEDNFDWNAFSTQIRIDAYYTKTGITLQEIAKQYNMSTRTLSFIINHFTNDNFQNYVNALRIGFVLEQFNKGVHQNKTLESIGAEAGFGSKSAFFYSFKRCTGKTPKEYIIQNNL